MGKPELVASKHKMKQWLSTEEGILSLNIPSPETGATLLNEAVSNNLTDTVELLLSYNDTLPTQVGHPPYCY